MTSENIWGEGQLHAELCQLQRKWNFNLPINIGGFGDTDKSKEQWKTYPELSLILPVLPVVWTQAIYQRPGTGRGSLLGCTTEKNGWVWEANRIASSHWKQFKRFCYGLKNSHPSSLMDLQILWPCRHRLEHSLPCSLGLGPTSTHSITVSNHH